MDQPPVDNPTDFVVHPQLFADKDGEKLVTIVKATCIREADGTLEVAPKRWQRKIRFADIPWGEPEKSSIRYPADICLRKPGTDVIVVAKAYAPGGKPVPTFDAAVRVGALQKIVRIFGLRVWQTGGSGLSPPRPIAEIEMRYDNAWGGADTSDPKDVLEEPRNPVGLGITRDLDALTHKPAPSIEDVSQPILTARTRPPPAGMGAVGRHWEPRRRYVGTYDDRWLEERAPLPPLDQDDRVNLCATPELVSVPPLRGGEEVALLNLTPGGGPTTFLLPKLAVQIEFRVKDRPPEVIRPYLDTVLIDTLANPRREERPLTLEYVWRASVPAPRRMQDARVLVREVS
ncbi:Hypothetical protein A7982_12211 [Minicystis rosea]|nr:Hypothetical protein A7982_12211 [Minicystis rosea]